MAISPAPLGACSVDPDLDSVADRRLAAGAYRDGDFRDQVLRDIYNARSRRIAPSYGFDLVLVVRHAWIAWWLEVGRQLMLLAALGCWFAVRPLDTFMALNLLVIGDLLRRWLSWVLEYVGYGGSPDPTRDRPEQVRERNLSLRGKLLKRSIAGALTVLTVLLLVSAGRRTQTSTASWGAHTTLTVAGVIITLIAILVATAAVQAWQFARLSSGAPRRRIRLRRRTRVIDQQQRHPITVHSGFKPFLGSGRKMRDWSFAQRLVRANPGGTGPGREFDPPPFTTMKLVGRLREVIAALQHDDNPETRLPGLRVADCVFVEGTRTASIGGALGSEPGSDEVGQAIADAITRPSGLARHYLRAQVVSWGGEVVTTVYVHVSLQGRTLYIEFATYALYPVRPEYGVDRPSGRHAGEIAGVIGAAVAGLPTHLLEVKRLVIAPAMLIPALRAASARTPKAVPYRDIGAQSSIRERAMIEPPSEFRNESESGYFQSQDIVQHSKIIERRLIAALDDYLKEFGVDTSEFVQRTTAILNNGILNTGSGTINAENTAVGENSMVFAEAGNS
jgi:hypothetical protein